MRCSVPNCTNDTRKTSKTQGVTFHMFPKEQHLQTSWIEAVGLTNWEPKERSTICSEHFHKDDFYETRCGLRRIKRNAVPDLTIVEDPIELNSVADFKTCRICLTIDTKMYHITQHNLDLLYHQILGLPVSIDDKLPQKLCWECAHRLLTAAKFRTKAATTRELLSNVLLNSPRITMRDVKSLSRSHRPSLVTSLHEVNDYDVYIKDNQVFVKTEHRRSDLDDDMKEEDELAEECEDQPPPNPMVELDIKDEQDTEIFYQEFPDTYDSEDDRKLSDVILQRDTEDCDENGSEETDALKKEKKLKKVKKKRKVEKVKAVKVKRKSKEEEDDDPETTMDKYKKSDVRRRKTQDALDESLFTISSLSYEEQIAEIEKRQESTSYKHAPFKCTVCYRGFTIQDRYAAHAVRHSEASGAYECFICKSRLKTGRALRKHLTAQHTEKFSCKGCPFVTRNRGVAREHEKWHAGTRYQCPHCPSEFDKLTTYMGHIRIKHVSDWVCSLCGYTFVSKKGVDVHKKKKHRLLDKQITLEGPYCEICDVKFISEEAHARHLKLSGRHSSDNDPNRIRNDSQSMNADRSGRVVRKIERRPVIHPRDPEGHRHAGTAGPITCEQCGVQLRDLRLYAQHFRRAHPDKNRTKYPAMKTPCMCEQCGRIFQSMALLKDHMWVHTGEKRFKCSCCEKSFTQKTNLVFHMRVHSAARPSYECPLCGKLFAFYNNRRRHMFIHTGLKPFKCETCGKCFTTSGEQRAHVDHVHLKKPWPKRARHARQEPWQHKQMPRVED